MFPSPWGSHLAYNSPLRAKAQTPAKRSGGPRGPKPLAPPTSPLREHHTSPRGRHQVPEGFWDLCVS